MYYSFAPITEERVWESFLRSHAPHALFQSWEWGDAVNAPQTPVSRIGMFFNNTLIGIMQIIIISAKRGKHLHIRHGPILDGYSGGKLRAMFGFVLEMAKKEGALFVRMNPLIEDTNENRLFYSAFGCIPSAIHAMDGEYCWVLDLDDSEDELFGAMRKTTRYDIRRGLESGVRVIQSSKISDLAEFHTLYKKTSERHGFVGHKGIDEEFSVFIKKDQAKLFLGYFQSTLYASALILFYGNQAIYHHGASIPSPVPVSAVIQWEAIKEAKKRGFSQYNFWGIAPDGADKHPWHGITVFKKGFGGRAVAYLHAQDLPVSPLYMVPRSIELIRKILKGY